MILIDVNVLVYAYLEESERHEDYRNWLLTVLNGPSAFGANDQILASFVRIATHPRIFREPSTLAEALAFAQDFREHPLCRLIRPGERHWNLFVDLCRRSGARANLITDAWHAALAIETGSVLITTDRDFARFPGLRWKHPLDHASIVENPQ